MVTVNVCSCRVFGHSYKKIVPSGVLDWMKNIQKITTSKQGGRLYFAFITEHVCVAKKKSVRNRIVVTIILIS